MFTEDKWIFLILKKQYMYRYKLYCCNVHCCDSDLFQFKEIWIIWLEKKIWIEKPKGKAQAKLVSSSGCNIKSYILNYSRLFRQKKIIKCSACQWKGNIVNTTVSLKPYIYNLPYKGTNTLKHSWHTCTNRRLWSGIKN